jgi:hypothetical protein
MNPFAGMGLKVALAGVALAATVGGLTYSLIKLDDRGGGPLQRAIAYADNARSRQLFDQEVENYQTILDFIARHGEDHAAVRAAGITAAQARARQEEAALDHVQQELSRAERSKGQEKKSALRSAQERLAAMRQRLPQSTRLTSYDVAPIQQKLAAAEEEIADGARASLAAAVAAADLANTTTPRAWTNIADYRKHLTAAGQQMRALDAGNPARRELGTQIGELGRRLDTETAYANFRLRANEDARNARLVAQLDETRTVFEIAQRELGRRRRTFHNHLDEYLARNPTARIPRPPANDAGTEPLSAPSREISAALDSAHYAARAYVQAAQALAEFDPTRAELSTRARTVASTLAGDEYRRGFDQFATALAAWRSNQLSPPPHDPEKPLPSPSEQLGAARAQLRSWETAVDRATPPGAAPAATPTPAPTATPAAAPGRQAALTEPALIDGEDLRRADG